MSELRQASSPGGDQLFESPVGRPRVAFNAHRGDSIRQIFDQDPELILKKWRNEFRRKVDGRIYE